MKEKNKIEKEIKKEEREKATEDVYSEDSSWEKEPVSEKKDNFFENNSEQKCLCGFSGNWKNIFPIITVAILFGMLGGFLAGKISFKKLDQSGFFQRENSELKENLSNQETENQTTIADQKKEDLTITDLVQKNSPAVVSIIVTKDVPKLDNYYLDPFSDDWFFFGTPRNQNNSNSQETEKREIGGGTGFLVDKDGFIITNRHVVSDENAEYTVLMNDGNKFTAKILAKDDYMDLAVLKIEGDNFPFVSLGNSDNLKIGQTVIAIGNSLGEFRNTVSKGIISGLKRSFSAGDGFGNSEFLDEVIQTDAAINPGNSGGPIIDLDGKVVGVNVAMAQGAENIGFSIPVNEVASVYKSVKETGKISRPFLGVRYVIIDEEIAGQNKLEVDYGALVIRGEKIADLAVVPGSPADKAGLVENDIILEIDGKKITLKNDLSKEVKKKKAGDEIELKISRKGKIETLKAVLENAN